MYKDVKLCLEEAEAAGVHMSVASAVRELWREANEEIGADKDFTELIRVLERRAGVEVKGGGRG
jgi:3-hydroxyisobutyrate dehydrogenase-like beta-hydroxyacid dehydrogenase